MYGFITTVPAAFYWARSDDTLRIGPNVITASALDSMLSSLNVKVVMIQYITNLTKWWVLDVQLRRL